MPLVMCVALKHCDRLAPLLTLKDIEAGLQVSTELETLRPLWCPHYTQDTNSELSVYYKVNFNAIACCIGVGTGGGTPQSVYYRPLH